MLGRASSAWEYSTVGARWATVMTGALVLDHLLPFTRSKNLLNVVRIWVEYLELGSIEGLEPP